MHAKKLKKPFFILCLFSILLGIGACNAKHEEDSDIVVTSSIVAVKNFYIQKNDSIIANLDSVFFSIDLDRGVIFNADSLPKGTKVNRLIPSITFSNTMTKVELEFRKDNLTDTIVNYLTNPNDSIDFTNPVKLNVTAQDGTSTYSYTIKVNVHNLVSDSIVWDALSVSELPSRLEAPVAQKTVSSKSKTYCLIEEYNGSYTLATTSDLNNPKWVKEELSNEFAPNIESFNISSDLLWVLSDSGNLYYSPNGINWNSTDQTWISVIGGYDGDILGVKETSESFHFVQYSSEEGVINEMDLDPEFPIYGFSQLGIIDTGWSSQPSAIIAGGVKDDNSFSSAIWAFDGSNWAEINMSSLPELKKPMLARYVVYKDTPQPFKYREFDAWLLFGGVDEYGYFNREVYISLDNGIKWSLAPEGIQLPDIIPSLEDSDVIVDAYTLSADLNDFWKAVNSYSTRSSYTIDGTEITWQCPYLYIFGGYSIYGSLSTNIWRGVLNRLTFTPII